MNKYLLLLSFQFISFFLFAQKDILVKHLDAQRINNPIKIDGNLDEINWQTAPIAKDFIELEPNPGITPDQLTEVKVLYDNKAIYISAVLFDNQPDSILSQLSQRDQIEITDWFGIIIDAYQDGQNGLGFFVTAPGVQVDTKYSIGSQNGRGGAATSGDRNWDAVWESATQFTSQGWQVEMKIPFSALRFPNAEEQVWNINFARMVRRTRSQTYWNEIKPEIEGFLNQSGQLHGIKNITTPLRLFATPYFSTYLENSYDGSANPKSNWTRSINGGMDVKYGINDAFTLDMTLIPDFGQTISDDQILNLSPFEIRFDENRQFFTEGLELFNKGDLFYTRRVGGTPLNYNNAFADVGEKEAVNNNPIESQLYNATKISGRTNNGLGVGFFNAVSAPTYATIENTEENTTREFQTSPLTNYNVVVFDQNLKNNSSVTFINTNVLRKGNDYDANVTGASFLLRNKANSYSLRGNGALSQKYFDGIDNEFGHTLNMTVAKTAGNFQWSALYSEQSDTYDPNDLGFLLSNNTRNVRLNAGYNIFKPFGNFNRAGFGVTSIYRRLYEPNVWFDFGFGFDVFMVTKNFMGFGIFSFFEPIETNDYFEPRLPNFERYFKYPTSYNVGGFISSDYRKKVAYDLNTNFRKFSTDGRYNFNFSIAPRLRVSDKIFFLLGFGNSFLRNDVGYVGHSENSINFYDLPNGNTIYRQLEETDEGYDTLPEDVIIFGTRDQREVINTIGASYIFNNKMGLTFRLRHYWTRVKYDSFHELDVAGRLQPTVYQGINDSGDFVHDTNFNIFNIDTEYRWRFAPGSDLIIVWKNSIFGSNPNIESNYFNNANDLLGAAQRNSISLRILYFLDYLSLKKD